MPYKDKEKQKQYHRKWYYDHKDKEKLRQRKKYKENPEKYNLIKQQYKDKIQNIIHQIKWDSKCICGESDFRCLDFHHIDKKEFCIAIGARYGLNKLIKEIEKCEIVCANCHRKMNNMAH